MTGTSQQMQALGITQYGSPVLAVLAGRMALPETAEQAQRLAGQLRVKLHEVAKVHNFTKGMGIAAPQIGISASVAIVRPVDGDEIVLINPEIVENSDATDKQYEGCLSFFDVRGLVARPVVIAVRDQTLDGGIQERAFTLGTARLVCHEIDHLNGVLYRDKLVPGTELVTDYPGAGRPWHYQA